MVTGPGMGGGTATTTGTGTAAVTAAGESGGATLGSVAGGAASALPYIAAWKIGMPYLRDIMHKGTESLTGADRNSGNVFQKANRMAGDVQGVVTPAYEFFTGNDMPEIIEATTNPAGYLAKKAGCIIVTACTSKDSPEVNITREYRDRYLTKEQLRGYYIVAEKIVPFINRFSFLKRIVKRFLVDKLVEYGKYKVDCGLYPSPSSILVTRTFLKLCQKMGEKQAVFVRCNGEVV